MKVQQINNIEQLRNEIIMWIEKVSTDPAYCQQGHEVFNGSGKILKSLQIQIDYANARKETPSIDFIGKV